MNLNKLVLVAAALVVSWSFISADDQGDDWIVPPAASKMKNPTDLNDAEGKAIGKSLYMRHCKSCHGKTGLGDGVKSEELDTPCSDFTTEKFQSQTDGDIFYKTKEGRDDMPGFGKKIKDDEEIWFIVNYLRGLE